MAPFCAVPLLTWNPHSIFMSKHHPLYVEEHVFPYKIRNKQTTWALKKFQFLTATQNLNSFGVEITADGWYFLFAVVTFIQPRSGNYKPQTKRLMSFLQNEASLWCMLTAAISPMVSEVWCVCDCCNDLSLLYTSFGPSSVPYSMHCHGPHRNTGSILEALNYQPLGHWWTLACSQVIKQQYDCIFVAEYDVTSGVTIIRFIWYVCLSAHPNYT